LNTGITFGNHWLACFISAGDFFAGSWSPLGSEMKVR
jgi:hypothetical protein